MYLIVFENMLKLYQKIHRYIRMSDIFIYEILNYSE